jgi:TonB-linked SusC/RagA family outer membrane protein
MEKLKLIRCLKTLLLIISTGLISAHLFAQEAPTITGKVVDEKGLPLIGATVKLKTAKGATTTDVNGHFSLQLPSDVNTITVTYIGYFPQDVSVKPTSRNMLITLLENPSNLNEVIVVGYGAQKKRDVTGAIATVSSKTLEEAPSTNVIDQLKGTTAGVDVVSNGSGLGSPDQIRIRGSRSLSVNPTQLNSLDGPLIVVDGIPFGGNINDLDQDNIQSLDILKDASATAIYGSRGSNGVILITTKRGTKGKAVVSYNMYYGNSDILGELKVFNGPEYAQYKMYSAQLNTLSPGSSGYPLTPAEIAGEANGTSTDWQKLIYQTGHNLNQNITLSGGDDNTQYGLAAGYLDQTGTIPNQNFSRYSLRTTIDHKINNTFRIGLNSLTTLSYNNNPGGTGITSGLLRLSPLTAPYNADGSLNLLPQAGSTDASTVNPLTLKTDPTAIYSNTRELRTFNSLFGEVNILKDLKYRINVGLDFTQVNGGNYTGADTYANSNITNLGQATTQVTNDEAYTYTIENLLIYDKVFAKKHHLTFTGLFSTQKDHQQNSQFNGIGLPADYIQNTNLALAGTINATPASVNPSANAFSERGLISEMARVNYGYDDRYLLTATIRRDGASVLAPGHQYLTYPAVALGWNIMNEQWMKNEISTIDNLKLRASYGVTGNQGSAPYQTLGALSQSYYNFGTSTAGQSAGYVVSTLANPTLTWQSTAEVNIGVDFGILKDRITGTIDVYNQNTKNIIVNNILPPSNGATSQISNLGKTNDKGLEFSVSTVNIQSRNGFNWTTDFNIAFDRNKVTALPNGALTDIPDGWFVGFPSTVIYDYKKIGIWQTGEPGLSAQTSPVQVPGQIRVEDVNGDGKITPADEQIIGNFQPQYTAGLTNRFTYRRFDLSVVIYARMGMMVEVPYLGADPGTGGYSFFEQGRNNQLKVDYWTPANPTNAFPKPDASAAAPLYGSTLSYVDGSFIKVRSINFGYTFPSKLLERAGISSLRIYFTAENPWILYSPFVKDGFGPDPEGNGYGGASTPQGQATNTAAGGAGLGRQVTVNADDPSVRNFNLGLSVKF